MTRYMAFVEADCGIAFEHSGDVEEAEAYLEKHVDTGDLGPPVVKHVEVDDK